jgi:hypothetical protein
MKLMMTVAGIGIMFAAAVAQTHAQDTTNVEANVQALNVALTGFVQQQGEGDVLTVRAVRVGTKDILTALSAERGAKLVLVTPTDGSDRMVWIRTGRGATATVTDVTSSFGGQPVFSVQKSKTNASGKVTGTAYSINHYTYGGGDNSIAFDVQGFTTTGLANGNFSSSVNGTGNINGSDAVLKGTISGGGGKIETISP